MIQEIRTDWQEIFQCRNCGWQEDYGHQLNPCKSAVERMITVHTLGDV